MSRIATVDPPPFPGHRSISFAAPVVERPTQRPEPGLGRLAWAGGAIPAGSSSWRHGKDRARLGRRRRSRPRASRRASRAPRRHDDPRSAPPARRRPRQRRTPRLRTGPTTRRGAPGPNRAATITIVGGRRHVRPGMYRLDVEMLDFGGRPLPAAETDRLSRASRSGCGATGRWDTTSSRVPTARVSSSGSRIPGSSPIPAAPDGLVRVPRSRREVARSVVTLTASSNDGDGSVAGALLASPLVADLLPGATVSFDVTGIAAVTGRTHELAGSRT